MENVLEWIAENAVTLSAVVTVILAIWSFFKKPWQWFLKKITKSSSVETFPPKKGLYNDEFYAYFKKCFKNAQRQIYITGDGFECKDTAGRERASNFANMMRGALDRGVSIIRVETRPNGSNEWANELADIKKKHRDKFQLYVFGASSSSQLSSTCVFDPESPTDSIVEIMLSVSRRFGTESGDLAGPGIFIRNEIDLAKSMADKIVELTKLPDVAEARDETAVRNLLSGTAFYFAYGSNMSQKQMLERIGTAEYVGSGYIENHTLTFNRKGTYRPGGVASIRPSSDKVWGVVWKMPSSDIAELTKIEDPTAYDRVLKTVTLKDGKNMDCSVYVARKQADFIQPEEEYIKLIISGAIKAELPDDYIAFLKKFRPQ